jgi:glycosyltransferase involved in cell wall biosynthesis
MFSACLVTREYPPVTPYSGGIGRQFGALAPALAAAGNEVHVITLGAGGAAETERDGVRLHLLAQTNPAARRGAARLARAWVWEDATWARSVDRRLAALGPLDVVYAPEWGGEAARFALRRARAAALVTNLQMSLQQMSIVEAGLARPRTGPRALLRRRMERLQAERSDTLVACSDAVLRWARELWDLGDVPATVLPNTTDVRRVRALGAGAPPPWLPEERPLVAFSGRLEPRKGVHVLVEAMQLVWEEFPQARLLLVGGEPWTPGTGAQLCAAAGRHASKLILPGDQPPERLFPALAAADVVAFPSLWEAFGIAALEALALGRPAVLTSGSGFQEFAADGDNSLLVPPGDAGALGGALVRLLADEQLARRLGAAAAVTADSFDAEPVARRHADLFESMTGAA